MVSNPYHFSRLGTTVSAQLTDSVDAPHTGLIKALSVYSIGSYPVKTSTDFNITAATKSAINITSGRVVRDGELQAVITAGSSIAIGSTSAGKTYSLVVVNSSNAFAVRTTTTDNLIPELTAGDIPIAVVLFTDDSSTMEFQYFTNKKESNSVSIAYANSNVYTESGKITGDADSLDIVSSITNADINITPNGDGKIVLDGLNWPIADGNAGEFLKTNGSNQLSFSAVSIPASPAIEDNSGTPAFASGITKAEVLTLLNVADGATAYADANAISAVEGEATLDLTGTLTVANGVVFNEAGASVDFRVESNNNVNMLVVDGSQDGVGINVASPDAELHVNGVSKTKGLVVNLTEQTAAPAPFNTYDITDENYIIGNNLTLNLPSASSTRQGQIYRLILPVTGTGSLKIDVQSGDSLNDKTRSPLTTPYEILSQTTPTGAAGDIWEVICLSGTEWIAYKL